MVVGVVWYFFEEGGFGVVVCVVNVGMYVVVVVE